MANKLDLKHRLEETLGCKIQGQPEKYSYDDWLELFRKIPAARILGSKNWLNENLPVEGFAAASRWIEIIGSPTKMDKLYRGRLRAQTQESLVDLALDDDDEKFFEALIKKTAMEIDECTGNTNEIARLSMNLRIFKNELRDIRSRKPKQGTTLQKVLELAAAPKKPIKKEVKCKKKTRKSRIVGG